MIILQAGNFSLKQHTCQIQLVEIMQNASSEEMFDDF